MLVMEHAGAVLLEKRPDAGIWGGLWCFPELPPHARVDETCHRCFGARVGIIDPLPVVEHGFTHFTLTIRPRRVTVTTLDARVREPGTVWLPVAEASMAAIPAPVRRILSSL